MKTKNDEDVKFEMGIKRLLLEKSTNKYKIVSLNWIVIHFNKILISEPLWFL